MNIIDETFGGGYTVRGKKWLCNNKNEEEGVCRK